MRWVFSNIFLFTFFFCWIQNIIIYFLTLLQCLQLSLLWVFRDLVEICWETLPAGLYWPICRCVLSKSNGVVCKTSRLKWGVHWDVYVHGDIHIMLSIPDKMRISPCRLMAYWNSWSTNSCCTSALAVKYLLNYRRDVCVCVSMLWRKMNYAAV